MRRKLAILATSAVLVMPLPSRAQDAVNARQAVPFVVGEELVYRATFGKIRARKIRYSRVCRQRTDTCEGPVPATASECGASR